MIDSARERIELHPSRPASFSWVDGDYADLVRELRLDDLEVMLIRRDGRAVAAGHRIRETVRLDVVYDSSPHALYVKREFYTPWKYRLANVAAGHGPWSKARGEFEALAHLRKSGVLCPRPIVCLQDGLWRTRGCLVLEELCGFVELNRFLAQRPFANAGRRDAFFALLGRDVARLHAAGVNQPDLYGIHVHIRPQGDDWRIAFLDFQRSHVRSAVPLAERARDLAALIATLPDRLADPRDRETLCESYLAESGWQGRASELLSAVRRRADKLLTRRKTWEIRESDTAEHQSAPRLEPAGSVTLWIDRAFRPLLEQSGLTTFESMMRTTQGELMRRLADRENWRLRLDDGHGEAKGAYLKKHHVRDWRTRLAARLFARPGRSAGRTEATNVALLARGGIAAMRLIAYGERLHQDGLLESFVLTEELVGFTQLDHFLRRRFPPLAGRAEDRDADLTRLIRDVAVVAARFHRLGYNHRDFYCCHFFIREPTPGAFLVNLIDLQRVEHRHRLRRRWLVKDLAQLAYSVPRDRISCGRRMAFIKHYLGVDKLRPQDKRLIKAVLAKQAMMERNLGAHP